MNEEQAADLRKLHNFIRDELPEKNLDMDVVCSAVSIEETKDWSCGTAFCVYGCCPLALPESFEFREDSDMGVFVTPVNGLEAPYYEAFAEHFGVNKIEASFITDPSAYEEYSEVEGGWVSNPTKGDVLERIRALAWKYGHEIRAQGDRCGFSNTKAG